MKTKLCFPLALVAVLGSGCSGINVSKSVSPLDFIVPGVMQNVPSPTPGPVPGDTNNPPLLAGNPSCHPLLEPAGSSSAQSGARAAARSNRTASPAGGSDGPAEICRFAN